MSVSTGGLYERLSQIDQQLEAMNQGYQKLEKQNDDLKAKLDRFRGQQENLEGSVSIQSENLQNQIDTIRGTIGDLTLEEKEDADNVRSLTEELFKRVEELERGVFAFTESDQSRVGKLESRVNMLAREVERLGAIIETHKLFSPKVGNTKDEKEERKMLKVSSMEPSGHLSNNIYLNFTDGSYLIMAEEKWEAIRDFFDD